MKNVIDWNYVKLFSYFMVILRYFLFSFENINNYVQIFFNFHKTYVVVIIFVESFCNLVQNQ